MNEFEPLTTQELIRMHLQQPEYLHVVLNPLPGYGFLFGLIAMLAATALRDRRAELVALLLIFLSALSVWPVAHYGEEAYNLILGLTDEDGRAWLKEHASQGRRWLPLFAAVGLLSAGAAIFPKIWPETRKLLWFATLLGALAALTAGAWIGYSGGKIRHKEFRYAPPPQNSVIEGASGNRGASSPTKVSFDQMAQTSYS